MMAVMSPLFRMVRDGEVWQTRPAAKGCESMPLVQGASVQQAPPAQTSPGKRPPAYGGARAQPFSSQPRGVPGSFGKASSWRDRQPGPAALPELSGRSHRPSRAPPGTVEPQQPDRACGAGCGRARALIAPAALGKHKGAAQPQVPCWFR